MMVHLKKSNSSQTKGDTIDLYVLSWKQQVLSAQAHWYCYAEQQISKRTFGNESFRNLLATVAGKTVEETPILTPYMLGEYVKSETEVLKKIMKVIFDLKRKQAKGNKFGQAIRDGATAVNGKKFQAFGIQFVDPSWHGNIVLCTGFVQSNDGSSTSIANLYKKHFYTHLHSLS